MLERLIDAAGRIADNVWAFLLFVLAVFTAVVSALVGMIIAFHFHSPDMTISKELLGFAGTLAMTGAALMHSKSGGDKKDS